MLHRAARNAYSWWWATHIRTKQSKWLEQNLQDMEEKVEYILTIINEDGDSFMMKAEMFFRKRPELVNFIEDCFKGYRALAERYDKLSKDMQNANRTIATVFPEKMQLNDDFDDDLPQVSSSSSDSERPPVSFPAPPEYISPKKSPSFSAKSLKSPTRLMSKRGLIKLGSTDDDDDATAATKKSGLSKSEALVEIDRLQKDILALQTEKEFIKSSYENGIAKCLDIENEVTVMQAKVSSLQDEFGIEKVIEDDEARMLMAATALNSCQEKLTTLQDKQEQSIEEAKGQTKKVEKVREKFETMIEQLTKDKSEKNDSVGETKKSEDSDQNVSSIEELSNNLGLVKNSLKEQLRVTSDSSLTVSELAEKIDELVDTVLNLESAVSCQSALVNILRSESNELQEKIQSLEGDKETLTDSSDHKNKRIRDLENELNILQCFKQSVIDENKNSQNQSKVESFKIDNSGVKVQNVESQEPMKEVPGVNNMMMSLEGKHTGDLRTDKKVQKDENHESKPELQSEQRKNHLNGSMQELIKMKDNEKKLESLSLTNDVDAQESGILEEHQLNWRELLLNDLEDREKLLLEEYTSLLKNYKQVKQKLSDAEKKHRTNLFKSTVQIKVLKTANASKDAEIQSLNKKLNTLQPSDHDVSNTNASTERDSSQGSEMPSPNLEPKEACDMLRGQEESNENAIELTAAEELNVSEKYSSGELKLAPGISSIEEKIRMDLDELLEENIEFWLRYSTSFHQVQKFQTAFEDLQAELAELNESKKQEGSPLDKSDVRPIYMHLREIHTELSLWLEQNEVLEDDLQNRSSSITCIQEEISRLSNAGSDASQHVADETELSDYQAAKFTGEVMNMKQENNKVADELLGGIERVKKLKVEIEVTVAKLDQEFGFSAARNQHAKHSKHKIPLRSFLFGVKLKKQKASLLKCMAPPSVNKQPHSDVCEVVPPPSR